ncbi:hypothetical protein R3P38DRAFT_2952386 [Favolaschia claudopus]|uniref:Uncharacterized protein n=1 Tax=Favolaschia claudopus TaxID=2862362 RepID=A0AAW0BG10_9AGAR
MGRNAPEIRRPPARRFAPRRLPHQAVQNLGGVARDSTRGLQLMNEVLELGPQAPTRLPRPDFRAEQAASASAPNIFEQNGTPYAPLPPSARTQETM